ncbi:MAG: NEW3 domain-containing protein [Xanthobacteraceae bacterium]
MRDALLAALSALFLSLAPAAQAADAPDVKGLYLLTDYPAVTVRPGNTSTISLRLQNYALPPERFKLSVEGVPDGWTATLLGGGQPVAAAMPATNSNVVLQLRLDVPAKAEIGTHTLTVRAEGEGNTVSLPIAVSLAKDLPAKLTLEPKLPSLRGSARSSFEYQVSIKNDSGKTLLVSLAAQAPPSFDTSFTEAYGSQELSSIPVEAGQPKDVKLRVRPPATVKAGQYTVTMRVGAEDATAETRVVLDVTGQPQLGISGRDGVLSAAATAGKETSIPVEVTNTGTATADEVELSGSGPNGWKIAFEPKTITGLAPGQNSEVQALVTPPEKAVAGDYVTTLRAAARGESATASFRVAVSTSTLWGVVGLGVIGIALLVLVGAVARFGRR